LTLIFNERHDFPFFLVLDRQKLMLHISSGSLLSLENTTM